MRSGLFRVAWALESAQLDVLGFQTTLGFALAGLMYEVRDWLRGAEREGRRSMNEWTQADQWDYLDRRVTYLEQFMVAVEKERAAERQALEQVRAELEERRRSAAVDHMTYTLRHKADAREISMLKAELEEERTARRDNTFERDR